MLELCYITRADLLILLPVILALAEEKLGICMVLCQKVTNSFQAGVLTGKGLHYGGSLVRTQATGYGLLYFMDENAKRQGHFYEG